MGDELTSTDPNGVTTTNSYNPDGQITNVSYSGSAAHSASYSYDAEGNRTTMTDATGTSTFSYDTFGELTSATNGAGQVTGYSYNPDGEPGTITYPLPAGASWAASKSVSYGYDKAGQLTSVTDFNGNAITIGNTADGLPASETLASSGDTITTTYDSTDTPSAVRLKNATSALQSFTYSYSPAGTTTNETDTPSSSQSPAVYSYDNHARVVSMTPGTGPASSYGFDTSSNLTTLPTGATVAPNGYDSAGELTSAALNGTTASWAYDADGQRLTAKQGSSTVASGTWNGAGQLTAYSNSAASMTRATYDGDGMRASTTITPSGGSPVSQGYVWNGDNLLMDGANAYIYAASGVPAEQVNLSTGAITYLVTDAIGSVRGAVGSSGTLTGTASYDAWGNPNAPGGLTATTPFGYAGGYSDPTGLIYLINRYYDPVTGQFTSLDSQVDQTIQPYSYAGGNPVDNTDPTGLDPRPCGPVIPSDRYCRARDFTYNSIVSALHAKVFRTIKKDWHGDACVFPWYHIYCLTALKLWKGQVHAGGPWDLKVPLHKKAWLHSRDAEKGELPFFSRLTKKRQIYFNVWGNIFYGYVGRKEGFSAGVLESSALINSLLHGEMHTPGNRIERHMAYALYNLGGTLTPGEITTVILQRLSSLSHYCDALPFPEASYPRRCNNPANW